MEPLFLQRRNQVINLIGNTFEVLPTFCVIAHADNQGITTLVQPNLVSGLVFNGDKNNSSLGNSRAACPGSLRSTNI